MNWIQSIKCLLYENGFGNVWVNPRCVNRDTFHKYFKLRLNDQNVQNWRSKLDTSSRFTILKLLDQNYSMAEYVKKVTNPSARGVFTRLRIDMNILLTSKVSDNSNNALCFFM